MANPDFVAYSIATNQYQYCDKESDAPSGWTVLTWAQWLDYLAGIVTPIPSFEVALSAGDNNNLSVIFDSVNATELTTTASNSSITGIASIGVPDGQVLTVRNNSVQTVTVRNNSPKSTAGNRFFIGGDLQIKPSESRTFIYAKGYWRTK